MEMERLDDQCRLCMQIKRFATIKNNLILYRYCKTYSTPCVVLTPSPEIKSLLVVRNLEHNLLHLEPESNTVVSWRDKLLPIVRR